MAREGAKSYGWKDHKVLIFAPVAQSGCKVITVIRPWWHGTACWRFNPEQGWAAYWPNDSEFDVRSIRLACKEGYATAHYIRCFSAALAEVPSDVLSVIGRFQDAHYPLLHAACYLGQPFRELAVVSSRGGVPALALLLAARRRLLSREYWPLEFARRSLKRKRRNILASVAEELASDAVVNILSRIAPRSLSVVRLRFLLAALRHPEIRDIFARRSIVLTPDVVRVVTDDRLRPHVSAALWAELSRPFKKAPRSIRPLRAYCLLESVSLAERLGVTVPAFGSMKQVVEFHRRTARDMVKGEMLKDLGYCHSQNPRFPPLHSLLGYREDDLAPLRSAFGGFAQILTSEALYAHCHHEMSHCGYSYLRRVLEGEVCFWRIEEHDEIATLALGRRSCEAGDLFFVEDCRGIRNNASSDRMWVRVREFVSRLNQLQRYDLQLLPSSEELE